MSRCSTRARNSTRLKQRLVDAGAELIAPLRATPFERVFFREPVNGYVFEVIAQNPCRQPLGPVERHRHRVRYW